MSLKVFDLRKGMTLRCLRRFLGRAIPSCTFNHRMHFFKYLIMKQFLLVFLVMFTGALTAFSQDYVTLYADCNYRGNASKLYPGRYSLSSQNVGQNSLSSIRVPYGFKVVIYDADQPGQGNKTRYTSDISCLPGEWNDRAASVVVERDGDNNNNNDYNNSDYASRNDGVIVFEDCHYGGRS